MSHAPRLPPSGQSGTRPPQSGQLSPALDAAPSEAPLRILFATSELYPWVKVGGLGDVAFALPLALLSLADHCPTTGATTQPATARSDPTGARDHTSRPTELRVVLPAYPGALAAARDLHYCGHVVAGYEPDAPRARIFSAHLAARFCNRQGERQHCELDVWLVDLVQAFDRDGNPYTDPTGHGWPDNAERFWRFSAAIAEIATGALTIDDRPWRADVVHANDWQTGPALLALQPATPSPRKIFTIHNLAYDNPLTRDQFEKLNLPASWWHIDHAEFWGYFSPMKAGITSADIITTVSPRYAREIRTPAFGEGFDGLLAAQTHKIVGIINGIDDCTWDPRRDPLLPSNYSADDDIRTIKQAIAETLSDLVEPSISRLPDRIHSPVTHSSVALMAGPAASRPTLPSPSASPTDAEIEKADEPTAVTTSERRGLTASPDRRAPMFGFIGRFVEQKGLDLVLAAIPRLLTEHDLRFVLLGSGQPDLESRARELALLFPEQVRVQIGYDETLAHRIEAAADFFLMPSRFEPCGLNQLYSLRYGTIPIVSPIGGLADSVVDADSRHLEEGTATGFHLRQIDTEGIVARVRDVMAMWHSNRDMLDSIARRGMQLDLGWSRSAAAYRQLYEAPLTRPIEDLLRGTTLHSVNDPNT